MKTNRFTMNTWLRAWSMVMAAVVVACDDLTLSGPATVTDAETYVAAAETEDEAWSRAYTWLRATEHPQAMLLMERLMGEYPDSTRWEYVRGWNAEEAARHLRPWIRCANAIREGIAAGMSVEEVVAEYGVPATAQDTAEVRAMNGVAHYLRGIVEGRDPSPRLLDDMRNLELPWPWWATNTGTNHWGDKLTAPVLEARK